MKREELRKLGLTDEQIDSIMSIHGDDMNAQKATLAQKDEQITALTTERDGLKTQVGDRDKDIATLKKSTGDNEALTKQLNDLQARYDTETTTLKKTLDDQARDHAVESLFTGLEFTSALARKAAIAEFKAANPEFKDGKFSDAETHVKKLKEQYPDAFKVKEKEKDDPETDPNTTPASNKQPPKFTMPINNPGEKGSNNPFQFTFQPVRGAANGAGGTGGK